MAPRRSQSMATAGFRCNEPEPVSDDDDDDEVVTVVQPVGEAPASATRPTAASPTSSRASASCSTVGRARDPRGRLRLRDVRRKQGTVRRTSRRRATVRDGRRRLFRGGRGGAPSSGRLRRNSINPRRDSIHAAAKALAATSCIGWPTASEKEHEGAEAARRLQSAPHRWRSDVEAADPAAAARRRG